MRLDVGQTLPLLHLPNDPGDRLTERFPQHRATGLADGRQAYASPFLRTVMPQLAHRGAVRQEHEIHVPGLALAEASLTRAHAQMLLPVPMEGLGDSPALAIGLEDAMHLRVGAVGDQDLAGSSSRCCFQSTTIRTVWLTPGMRMLLVKYHCAFPSMVVLRRQSGPSCIF